MTIREKMRSILRRSRHILLLVFGSIPAPLLLLQAMAPDKTGLCPIFAGTLFLFLLLCLAVPGKVRLGTGLLGCWAIIALGLFLLPFKEHFLLLLIPILYTGLLLGGMRIGSWPEDQEVSVVYCVICLFVYLLAQILMIFGGGGIGKPSPYTAVDLPVKLCFLVFVVLWMLAANRITLDRAATTANHAPVSMRRKNTLLTLLLVFIVVGIAMIPTVSNMVKAAWDALVNAVVAIFRWLSSLFPADESNEMAAAGEAGFMGFGEAAGDPSPFEKILEKILLVFALLACAAVLYFMGRKIWKKLKILFARLKVLLAQYTQAVSEDYVDEFDDTRSLEENSRMHRKRRRKPVWYKGGTLTSAEKVRYAYWTLLQKHPEWKDSSTARENLAESAADIYEEVRYSDNSISSEEADRFTDITDTTAHIGRSVRRQR